MKNPSQTLRRLTGIAEAARHGADATHRHVTLRRYFAEAAPIVAAAYSGMIESDMKSGATSRARHAALEFLGNKFETACEWLVRDMRKDPHRTFARVTNAVAGIRASADAHRRVGDLLDEAGRRLQLTLEYASEIPVVAVKRPPEGGSTTKTRELAARRRPQLQAAA